MLFLKARGNPFYMNRIKERIQKMSLRHKAWLVTLIILLSLFIVIGGSIDYFLAKSFRRLEQSSIEKTVLRVRQLVMSEINNLKRITHDYAVWTDTYDFMMTRNRDYVRSNINPEVMKNLQLSGVFLCYTDGRRAVGFILDAGGGMSVADDKWDSDVIDIIKSSAEAGAPERAGIKIINNTLSGLLGKPYPSKSDLISLKLNC